MADDVQVQFGAQVSGLLGGVNQVTNSLLGLADPVNGLVSKFAAAGEAIAAAFAVEKIIGFVEKMGELGLQVERTAAMLGLGNEQVVQLGGMAKITGTSMEGLTLSLERMALKIQESTRDAFNPAAQGLAVLGLKASDLIGIPTSQYIDKLHDAVSKFNPSLNLTTAVMAVGSRGVAQMIPLLQKTGAEWAEMKSQIDAATVGMAAAVPGMAEVHAQSGLLSLSMQSLGAAIMSQLNPAIETIIKQLTGFVQEVRDSIKEGGAWWAVLMGVEYTIKGIATGIASVAAMVRFLNVEAQAFWNTTKDNAEEVGKKLEKDLAKIASDYKKTITDLWSHPAEVRVPRAPGQDAGSLNAGARTAAAERLELVKKEAELASNILKAQYGNFIFTEGAKTQALKAELDKRLAEELAVAGQSATKRKILETQYKIDVQKLYQEEAKAYEGAWNTAFGGIQSAFNSQLKGLLAGTVTFGQAAKAMFGDLVVFAIQQFEKMAFEWAAHQIAMTMVGEAQNAARTASDVAATTATLPERIAKFTSDITSDAALVFAGIFASMAPLLGPAAAGPAAAGQATTLAQLANVPKFETGAWQIPRTMGAIVHPGETILPAKAAQTFRDMANGGGQGGSVIIQALDAVDVHRWVAKNRDVLASAVSHVFTRQRSMRPALS